MGSSSTEVRHLRVGEQDFLNDLSHIRCQKVMTRIKHRMAVQKTLDLIRGRIQDPPRLCEVAFLAGLSRTYFSPVFKEVVGMGLQDYLICARIDKAKELLSDINLTIKQIAYEAGFKDPDHFCRTFKKKTGTTPTDWRLRKLEDSLPISLQKDHNNKRIERRK